MGSVKFTFVDQDKSMVITKNVADSVYCDIIIIIIVIIIAMMIIIIIIGVIFIFTIVIIIVNSKRNERVLIKIRLPTRFACHL